MIDGVVIVKIPLNKWRSKTVKFWFGMYVWQSIIEKHGIYYDEMGQIGDENLIPEALYFAQEYAALKAHKRPLSLEQIKKSVDLMPQKVLNKIVQTMLLSKIGGDSILGKIEGSKKKQEPQK